MNRELNPKSNYCIENDHDQSVLHQVWPKQPKWEASSDICLIISTKGWLEGTRRWDQSEEQ
jgi:hypothetical protein